MTPDLPGPLAPLAPLLTNYGYPALAVLVFLDNMLVPVPGQTMLVAAAVYAGAGRLDIAAVAVTAVLAAVAGGCAAYLLGRGGGRRLLHRFGRYVLLTPERLHRAEESFTRRGGWVVTIARFVDGLRQTFGLLAGAAEMPWHRFLAYNTAGALAWVGAWAGAGYAAGTDIGPLYHHILHYQLYALLALAALLAFALLRRRARRRRTPAGQGGGHG